jgi:hypothetical protein
MITPAEIKAKAEKKYPAYLQSVVEESPFTEIVIIGDKKPSRTFAEFEKELTELKSRSKEQKGYGYTIKYQTISKKDIGKQDLPIEISFLTETDFLKYLHKEKEVAIFRENIKLILSKFSELKEWTIKYPLKVIEYHNKWNYLLTVCNYFKSTPKPNLYIRELPVQVHTKFIENNRSIIKELLDIIIINYINSNETNFEKRFNLKYDEPKVRFRILGKILADTYFSGFDDLSIPISKFRQLNLPLQKVFVVENKMNVLTFPIIEKSIVIFGSGYGIENLKNTKWLNNVELLYWGDIDVQGFEILSQFRGYFSHTRSILMDKETFESFEKDKSDGTPSRITTSLNLTEDEKLLYELLKTNNWRLEQEKIPLEYVNEFINHNG